jgi:hypothetical protein
MKGVEGFEEMVSMFNRDSRASNELNLAGLSVSRICAWAVRPFGIRHPDA